MSSDLDAMHYSRTDKNHNREENERRARDDDEDEASIPGDADLWAKLR